MKIYVGNLPIDTTDEQFSDLALPYGELTSSHIIRGRARADVACFGFLHFASSEHARKAIAGLNGRMLRGRLISVSSASNQSEHVPVATDSTSVN